MDDDDGDDDDDDDGNDEDDDGGRWLFSVMAVAPAVQSTIIAELSGVLPWKFARDPRGKDEDEDEEEMSLVPPAPVVDVDITAASDKEGPLLLFIIV